MKYVFVTGFTGLVGSGFLFNILKNNYDISNYVALCREKSDVSILEKYCLVERGSSYDEERLNFLFNKYDFDTIIHISNKDQIVKFAKLAIKHNIKKYIAISSTYACSTKCPNNVTAQNEQVAEKLLIKNGIDYIFLRPTSIFGTRPDGKKDRNLSVFTNYVLKYPLFPLFKHGTATVRPCWGRDVGLALYIILTHFEELKNNKYICSGDKQRTFKELIIEIGRLYNKKVHFLYLPYWFGCLFFYSIFYISFKKIDKREQIRRLVENKAFESSQELVSLGYSPHSFQEAFMINEVMNNE